MNSLKVIKENKPWYEEGLKFKCTQCGKCCSGKYGFVWLSEDDIEKISNFLNISKKEFLEKYTKPAYGRISLIDADENGDCIFLKDKKCLIYPARPKQCKTFPWWSSIVKNKKSWEEFKEFCEGIDHQDGKHYSFEEIEENLNEMK